MIFEIDKAKIGAPYDGRSGPAYIARGLVNPLAFSPKFLTTAWVPFENFDFELNEVEKIFGGKPKNCGIFRQDTSKNKVDFPFFEIQEPNKLDFIAIKRWLDYSSNVIWFDDGTIIINSFSDLVIMNLDETLSKSVYGLTLMEMFNESDMLFSNSGRQDQGVRDFMAAIRKTWNHGLT